MFIFIYVHKYLKNAAYSLKEYIHIRKKIYLLLFKKKMIEKLVLVWYILMWFFWYNPASEKQFYDTIFQYNAS